MGPFQLNKKHRGHEFLEFLIGYSWIGLLGKHREQKTKSCLAYLSSTSGHQSHRLTPNFRTDPLSKCTGSTGKPACKSCAFNCLSKDITTANAPETTPLCDSQVQTS